MNPHEGLATGDRTSPDLAPPWALLAEVTHACPLHCPYCSNPLELTRRAAELSASEWARVMGEAADLGVMHAHISGGEPLLRPDLASIVAAASEAGIYTQLVTSGVGLTAERLDDLIAHGLHSVQLSVQDATASGSDRIAGRRSFTDKERAAKIIRASGLPLGVNVVLHKHNLDHVNDIIELALGWGAERLELANAQYYGWALRNRGALLPSAEQVQRAEQVATRWRDQLGHTMDIIWVVSDYLEGVAKPCMGGWASQSITVAPDGTVLPCTASAAIPTLTLPNAREHSLAWIWSESPAFTAYRGFDWMQEPCRSCERRTIDFGGCRCQAFALLGDATRTDPACHLSPDHHLIRELVDTAADADDEFVYRRPSRVQFG